MSNSAPLKQYRAKVEAPDMGRTESPSTARINLNVHKNIDPTKIKVGKKVAMHVVGKITAHNHNEYGHHMDIEVSEIRPHARTKDPQ